VTRQLILRGLVLIAVDAVIMGLPRVAMGFYSLHGAHLQFGVCLLLLAVMT